MKKTAILVLAIISISTLVIIACNQTRAKEPVVEKEITSQESLIKRGEYLVSAIGCDDCHSPKKMGPNGPEVDFERRFSGHPSNEPVGKADLRVMKEGWVLFGMGLTAAVGPWGLSYAANISSDSTGIGLWKEEQFINAIRKGWSKGLEGNRQLLPPMPWPIYRNFNDEDLKAVFAYLKSTRPVKNVVPQPRQLKEL
jgi:cytochrome c553